MGTQAVSPYQQVIEKTKGLAFKSQMLVLNIEKKLGAKDQNSKEVSKVCTVCIDGCSIKMIWGYYVWQIFMHSFQHVDGLLK